MAITSSGIGSGLDIESLITKLMTVEKQPLTALQKKEASYHAKLTAYGSLKGYLSQFQSSVSALASASQFQNTRATVADSTVATATTTSIAVAGSYSLEVGKLAQAQTLVAAGRTRSTDSIGNGTITIDFGTISGGTFNSVTGKYTDAEFNSSGSGAKTITIDGSNNSLAGIRDAINKANIGVTASIVNDGSGTPYRLTLSSTNSGSVNSMKISVSGDAALSDLLSNDPAATQNLSETTTAQNAELKVNGISVSKASNSISDVISGVTLNLVKTTTSATSITVSRDAASVEKAVTSFVTAYNTLSQALKDATAYNAETKQAAMLNGEASVRTIQTQLRSILNTPVSGGATALTTLSQVGVTVQKTGLLAVDNAKLQSALNSNFSDFAGLFAAAGKTSDSLIAYAGSTSSTKVGAYGVNVTQLATMGNIVGSGMAGTVIDASNNTLSVHLDGNAATITLATGTYTAATLAAEIQSKINGTTTFSSAGSTVRVTQSGGILTLTSDRYGSASEVKITGGSGRDYLALGDSAATTAGLDVAGTINGAIATGSGQTLTGAKNNASEGIKILISGGSTGIRGTVNYSQGFAYRFNQLVEGLLDEEGVIASRTGGLNSIIERLQDDQKRVSTRLATVEKRYRAQFTALDLLMSKMNTTSSYLAQQLSALENLNKQASS